MGPAISTTSISSIVLAHAVEFVQAVYAISLLARVTCMTENATSTKRTTEGGACVMLGLYRTTTTVVIVTASITVTLVLAKCTRSTLVVPVHAMG